MNHREIVETLTSIGAAICDRVHQAVREQSIQRLSAVHEQTEADTIYRIDKEVENWLLPELERVAAGWGGLVLIAEGIGEADAPPVLPKGMTQDDAALRVIIDPIDGTRGIMYDKRSAFFLAGVAPNRGAATSLQDIEAAVMVELPASKSIFSDTLSVIRGQGVQGRRRNLLTGGEQPLTVQPSSAPTILGGFAQIARFFPPAKGLLAAIEEELVETLFPQAPPGQAILFEDQYISSGGQLYELLMGHDRFVADIRGIAFRRLRREGKTTGLTCHPYDVCAHLIGTEAGLIVTGPEGEPLDGPLDTLSTVDWIAYANEAIRREVEPVLQAILRREGLLNHSPAAAPAPSVHHPRKATARAAGRLDVMGGVADYSGSLLLEMPIREQTTVTISTRGDGRFRLSSSNSHSSISPEQVEVGLEDFFESGSTSLLPYEDFRRRIRERTGAVWPLYVLGCYYELMRTKGLSTQGADIEIESEVPVGRGVSSSAALEVATLQTMSRLYHLQLPDLELPVMAQRVENRVVGAPCGLMDQLTSHFGWPDHLLPIRCQPAVIYAPIPIPSEICFAGIDSGVSHAVSGDPYTDVRIAAFMGYTIIAREEGATGEELRHARQTGDWSGLPFKGYLANIDSATFHNRYAPLLPDTIRGADFLAQYEAIIDAVTRVDPEKTYSVQVCTRHPVEENRRIQSFHELLQRWEKIANKESALQQLGAHMLASHRSYSAIGLGSRRTDELVEALMERGANDGIYGARVTGGGSGGTVGLLCYGEDGKQNAREVAEEFGEEHGYEPYLVNLG